MFQVSASPTSGGDAIAGRVLLDKSNSDVGFSSHISFSLDLLAGGYEITVKYGGIADQHLLGSPFQLRVAAGPTSPSTTECKLAQFVTAGDELEAMIIPKDLGGSRTSHSSDSFSVWIQGSQSSEEEEAARHFNTTTQLSHFLYTKSVTVSGPNCEFAWICWKQVGLRVGIANLTLPFLQPSQHRPPCSSPWRPRDTGQPISVLCFSSCRGPCKLHA